LFTFNAVIARRFVIGICLCAFFLATFKMHAETQEMYTFSTPEQEADFNEVVQDLRCLVCQNQNLAESQAAFALDLKKEIQQWVLEGKTQKEIKDLLVSRYGDFILFNPPVKRSTYLLWAAPFILFLIAVTGLLKFLKK